MLGNDVSEFFLLHSNASERGWVGLLERWVALAQQNFSQHAKPDESLKCSLAAERGEIILLVVVCDD